MNLPTKPLPRTPLIAPVTYHSGTPRNPRFPFALPRVSAIRLGKSLVPAWRPRGPARRHRICWEAVFSDLLCFISFSQVFWRNAYRISDASDRIPGVTRRNLREPWLPFVLPRVFAIRLGKSLVPAWRPRGPARRHRIWWEAVFPDLLCFISFSHVFMDK